MNIRIQKRFLKDLAKIPKKDRQKIERFVFEESKTFVATEITEIFDKLQGYHSFYKIRFGNYRVGVHFENDTLTFERVLHRKEIYRYFP